MSAPDPLVSADALAGRLGQPDLTLIDATWTYPGGPEPRRAGAIPGARRIDIDAVADGASNLPHMLPSPEAFAAYARGVGVACAGEVVVYDRIGVASAPRAWWMFRAMGCDRVRVLDGGLPAWAAAGGPLADAPDDGPARPGDFEARFTPALVADRERVARALATGDAQVLDVRSRERFAGAAPEPRPGVRPGHMPGAFNVPWTELVAPDGRFASEDAQREAFARGGVSLDEPVVTSCGSGVTACIAALALERLGHRAWSVYDGSWAEWGSRADCAIAQGEAQPG